MVKDKFFKAEDLAPGVWRISNCFDSKERMQTYCYLIEGGERAMLIDTMFGYGNLRHFCRGLTDRPVFLVNTHAHGDHTGGNYDFDECYIHALDIPYLYGGEEPDRADRFRRMKAAALPEYRDMLLPTDFSDPHPLRVLPLWDGDIFELGARRIEVIHVGGHTPGEIVLLDRASGIAFTGDACNSNTLMCFPNALSVEEYLGFMRHLLTFTDQFNVCHGGHEDFPSGIVADGIAMCERVLAGTDDAEEASMFGMTCLYGARRAENGHNFNIAYTKEKLRRGEKRPRVL